MIRFYRASDHKFVFCPKGIGSGSSRQRTPFIGSRRIWIRYELKENIYINFYEKRIARVRKNEKGRYLVGDGDVIAQYQMLLVRWWGISTLPSFSSSFIVS